MPKRLDITIPEPSAFALGYLAGIMDGEGTFVVSIRSHSFGMRVQMTDLAVIEWLHENFSGSKSHAGVTVVGNRVHTWTLSRQADLAFVLPLLMPLLVAKRGQAEAMLRLIEHQRNQPRWDSRPSRTDVDAERRRRREVRAAWVARGVELRQAVRAARKLPVGIA